MILLTKEAFAKRFNQSVGLLDVRKVERDAKANLGRGALLSIQSTVLASMACPECDGSSDCEACHGRGYDRRYTIPRLFDRSRNVSERVLCSACLEVTKSEDACEHCEQPFIAPHSLEDDLLASLAPTEAA